MSVSLDNGVCSLVLLVPLPLEVWPGDGPLAAVGSGD